MAFSSGHHAGVPHCSACHSSHISTSETEGPTVWFFKFLSKFSSVTGSLNVTLLFGGVLQGTMAAYSESCFGDDSDFEPCCSSCFCFWSNFYCCFCCEFESKFMIYLCFSNLISQYHLEVLWQFLMSFGGLP